jgi:hypothetical protein
MTSHKKEPETEPIVSQFPWPMPKWSFFLVLIGGGLVALYLAIKFGLEWERHLFPNIAVRCEP